MANLGENLWKNIEAGKVATIRARAESGPSRPGAKRDVAPLTLCATGGA